MATAYPKMVSFGPAHKVLVNCGLVDKRPYAIVHRRNRKTGKFDQVFPWEMTGEEMRMREHALRRVGAAR